ncbi:membrane protein [Stemphylium lycopersici]|uniref:Membrane protein n=1 Tax=Stemphylium lycopersici TaxID=183478 RepID=A0A364N017_STELY|nr:hypothetical protein TW65_04310 [Stemphylium lycopersici]RAR00791.1 membrane protein [Stemphylium lycopersici]RAR08235.1 membrane protein [Stemphylium lycopersici]
MVAPAIVMGLRGVQVVFSIIVLGLTAYLVDATVSWSPASVDFMLFTSIWTILAVAYLFLAPTRFPAAAHKFAIAGVEFLTMLFWFASFVAVAAYWGDLWWVGGHSTYWSCGVTAIVFGAFLWVTFLFTTVLAALHIRGSPKNDPAPPNMAGV